MINGFDDLIAKYAEEFDGIADFEGKYMIVLREDAQPVIRSARKCSIHLKDELKAELDKMKKHQNNHQNMSSKQSQSRLTG